MSLARPPACERRSSTGTGPSSTTSAWRRRAGGLGPQRALPRGRRRRSRSPMSSSIFACASIYLVRSEIGLDSPRCRRPCSGQEPGAADARAARGGRARDQLGLDVFALGEHHRPDFLVPARRSSPRSPLAPSGSACRAPSRCWAPRTGPGLRAVRRARPDLRGPRRDHGRPRLVRRSSRCSATTSTTTTSCSRRSSSCCSRSAHRRPSPGRGATAPLENAGIFPDRCRIRCRVDRGRWQPAVGRPCRHPRPPPDDRDHRWSAGALPFVRRALPPQCRRGRPRARPRDQHTRVRRRHVRAGGQRVRRSLPRDDEPNRPRARLAAVGPREYEVLRSPHGALAVGSAEQVVEKILYEHEISVMTATSRR